MKIKAVTDSLLITLKLPPIYLHLHLHLISPLIFTVIIGFSPLQMSSVRSYATMTQDVSEKKSYLPFPFVHFLLIIRSHSNSMGYSLITRLNCCYLLVVMQKVALCSSYWLLDSIITMVIVRITVRYMISTLIKTGVTLIISPHTSVYSYHSTTTLSTITITF